MEDNTGTDNQLVRITYGLIAETYVYQDDCRVLRTKTTNTWPVLQDHFIKSQVDARKRQQTVSHRANHLL